jgi:hypothetical protein
MNEQESDVTLDKFKLRWYQEPVYNAIEQEGYKKVILVAARRSGKDLLGWNLAIRQCIKKPCLVYYVLPTYSQARKAIFDCLTSDGIKLLDYIPKQLVENINQAEMKIRFKGTDSILQCLGGDSYDTSLIGTNPYAIIFSEYSRMVDCYPYVRPILAANGGWCLFCSTPFGKNHFFSLVEFAKKLPDWKVFIQKSSEIRHISDDVLLIEKQQMSPELYEQEYECSFSRGVSGSYYGTAVDTARKEGRICPVAWEPSLLVHTSWDLGVSDDCVIIWWQTNSECTAVRIIDYYVNNNLGMDHYAKILQDKPYRYGYHFCPADIKVREFGGGAVTRYEKAAELGVSFTVVDQIPLVDGIDNVLANFNKFWFDITKTKRLVDALENYYREWDEERQVYKPKPVHNWASHPADAIRYLCLAINKTKRSTTAEDVERARRNYYYGNRSPLPRIFDDRISFDR